MKPIHHMNRKALKPEFAHRGLLKRLLDWIARGAEKSRLDGKSCPT